jgi:arginine/lysine/ornithine decarboxylase
MQALVWADITDTSPAAPHAAGCVLQLVVFVVGPGSTMADAEDLVQAFEQLSSLHTAAGCSDVTTQQTAAAAAAAAAAMDSSSAYSSSSSIASALSTQRTGNRQPHDQQQQQQQCAAMSPRDAFFADTQVIQIAAAAGRISAELLCPYPPGVPLVFPGEPLSSEVLQQLQATLAAGGVVTGARDATLETVLVVAN